MGLLMLTSNAMPPVSRYSLMRSILLGPMPGISFFCSHHHSHHTASDERSTQSNGGLQSWEAFQASLAAQNHADSGPRRTGMAHVSGKGYRVAYLYFG